MLAKAKDTFNHGIIVVIVIVFFFVAVVVAVIVIVVKITTPLSRPGMNPTTRLVVASKNKVFLQLAS